MIIQQADDRRAGNPLQANQTAITPLVEGGENIWLDRSQVEQHQAELRLGARRGLRFRRRGWG